jgi:hypothetical protein
LKGCPESFVCIVYLLFCMGCNSIHRICLYCPSVSAVGSGRATALFVRPGLLTTTSVAAGRFGLQN